MHFFLQHFIINIKMFIENKQKQTNKTNYKIIKIKNKINVTQKNNQKLNNYAKNSYSIYFQELANLLNFSEVQNKNHNYSTTKIKQVQPIKNLLQKYSKKNIPILVKKRLNKSPPVFMNLRQNCIQNQKRKLIKFRSKTATKNKSQQKQLQFFHPLQDLCQFQQPIQQMFLRSRKEWQQKTRLQQIMKNKLCLQQKTQQASSQIQINYIQRRNNFNNMEHKVQFKVLDQETRQNLQNIQKKYKIKDKDKKKVSSLHLKGYKKLEFEPMQDSKFFHNHFKKFKIKSQLSIPNQDFLQKQGKIIHAQCTNTLGQSLKNKNQQRKRNLLNILSDYQETDNLHTKTNKKMSFSMLNLIKAKNNQYGKCR